MSVLDKQFLFIVGAPRSGTSWLHRMLVGHPDVVGLPDAELTLFSRYLAPVEANYRKEKDAMDAGRWKQGLPVLWGPDRFHQHQRAFLEQAYAEVVKLDPQATHVLDKHPNYANHMPLIAAYLPQARFIHLVRDGREVAVSMMSVRKRVGHSPGEIREAARVWKQFVESAQQHGAAMPDRYLEVRYEEMRTRGAEGLKAIYSFCGLAADDALVQRVIAENDIRRNPVSSGEAAHSGVDAVDWRTRLDLRERYLFDRIAGGLLQRMGYAASGWWALRPTDRLVMAISAPLVRFRRALRVMGMAARAPLADQIELVHK